MSLSIADTSRLLLDRYAASTTRTAGGVQAMTLGGVTSAGSATLRCNCLQCQSTASGTVAYGGTIPAGTPVDYTDRIKKSGKVTIDALLAGGNRWFHTTGASGAVPAAAAKDVVTFSFMEDTTGLDPMDANGFQALNSAQRERVRDALDYYSKIIDVTFTEVASGGDLKYGSNAQTNSAGYARYPNEGSQVMIANNQAGFSSDWSDGTYSWMTLVHETGHALGLKHPGNYNAGGGGTPGPYLPAANDNRVNTIMSYKDAASMAQLHYANGYFSKTTVTARTLQGYDIAALQYLYGASTTVQADTYSFDAGGTLSATLWNPNAGSAIDLSNQSGTNFVDLRAGKRSSINIVDPYSDMPFTKAQYAALKSGGRLISSIIGKPTYTGKDNLLIAAGSQFTVATGGSGTDTLVGNTVGGTLDGGDGDDRLFWTGGDMTLTGGLGSDTAFLKSVAGAVWTVAADGSGALLRKTNPTTKVVTTLATVSFSGVESVRYWNGTTYAATGKVLYAAPAASPAPAPTLSAVA